MSETVRVGFVGAGIIARRHLGDLAGFDDVRVVAVADVALERARELAGSTGANAYSDVAEMIEAERLDALYICVPPFAHGKPEESAIAAGLPFFVEKPLSVDLPTAEQIAAAVEENRLVTAVGYHWRYLDITERAQDLLSANPARLVLGYWLDSTPPVAWWIREATGGGQFVEQTTHIFDLARQLVGEVDCVQGFGSRQERAEFPDADILDASVASLRFRSGAVGSVASTALLAWPHRIGLHLFSDRLAIELSEFELLVDVGKGRPIQLAEGDPFVREDRDFIDAVKGGQNRIRAPYAEALRTQRLAIAAARSLREGGAIEP
ncbi:MAG: Gfo/Idh/MocA family oxidoreductase [Chloroflexi bacterium]|nr:Gfo/Idh/MocA family oxidoreductase [Chloroflexota bacterium]